MKAFELNKSNKLFLSINDIAEILSITKESAKVSAARYVKKGYLIRLKKDFYILSGKFDNLREPDLFKIANFIQTPSYISLVSALSFYGITTQQQRNFVESIALKKTKNVTVKSISFTYSLVKKEFYEGFEYRQGRDNFFIALQDKALADIVYLFSLGRYNCDFDAIDFRKISKNNVQKLLRKTNQRTKITWDKLCANYKI
ncbi:MAG: type IV toxin-antitoxin system AbiEi family antitoxin domain-containing protein [Ignavibacteria bacterium]